MVSEGLFQDQGEVLVPFGLVGRADLRKPGDQNVAIRLQRDGPGEIVVLAEVHGLAAVVPEGAVERVADNSDFKRRERIG